MSPPLDDTGSAGEIGPAADDPAADDPPKRARRRPPPIILPKVAKVARRCRAKPLTETKDERKRRLGAERQARYIVNNGTGVKVFPAKLRVDDLKHVVVALGLIPEESATSHSNLVRALELLTCKLHDMTDTSLKALAKELKIV